MDKKTIYIADDDQAILESYTIILSAEGYDISTASNGKELKKLLEKGNIPHMIILDYFMPPADNGRIVTRDIRKDKKYENIPILIISANSKYRNKAISAGANYFLEKPINIHTLLSVVKKLMGE